MRWGLRSSKQQQRESLQPPEQAESKGKSKAAIFSSFSPLAWLASKLTPKQNAGVAAATKAAHATTTSAAANNTAHAATAFPPCFHKPTSPSSASASAPWSSLASSSSSSAAEAEAAAAAAGIVPRRDDAAGDTVAGGIAPRRRSVGNDDTCRAEAARQLYHRRHYSVGGDRDLPLPPFGHLVSPSTKAAAPPTPAPVRTLTPTPTLPPLPSDDDTDEEEEKPTTTRTRRRRRRRVVSGRRSFSSSAGGVARVATGAAVRVRSPRPSNAAVSELERFAVVRRTRDPQRAFRASMVEMIASKRMVGRPQELETLLACYLSLNADEHHDCIVKVFRQLWFELNNSNSNTTSRASAASVAAPPQRT